jgi:hypothetical protein
MRWRASPRTPITRGGFRAGVPDKVLLATHRSIEERRSIILAFFPASRLVRN